MTVIPQQGEDIPQFGELRDGLAYTPRPGAYGLALDEAGRILAIEVDSGAFLPGGGRHDGETDEQALRREVLEETGYEIEIGAPLGAAKQFVVSEREAKSFNKIGSFFLIQVGEQARPPSEPDHVTLWLPLRDAMARLREGYHRWALARALRHLQRPLEEPAVALRPYRPEDYDFARRLHHDTTKAYAVAFFGSWDAIALDARFAERLRPEAAEIVVHKDRDVGWLETQESAGALVLAQLYIVPEFQNHGIGTRILRGLVSRARHKGLDVTLAVLRNNPARRLYEREGFQRVGESEYQILMKRPLSGPE